MATARFHLPGLFEFYEFYKEFLPLFDNHREYFYEWVSIASIYGAPNDCIWSGGRFGLGESNMKVISLLEKYDISARLTFSNSLIRKEHLSDRKCNDLCRLFETDRAVKNGIIIHSDLLLEYLKKNYPNFYFVSSTTKVLTEFEQFHTELKREDFRYIVPDFRLNRQFDNLDLLSATEKSKVEFLCNECCWTGCNERKLCYENVSRRVLGEDFPEHICHAPNGNKGYLFSKAMKNPSFISIDDIKNIYLPSGFSEFKIEGRGLGSAIVLELLLYYLVKPEFQLHIREHIYLDSMLDLF